MPFIQAQTLRRDVDLDPFVACTSRCALCKEQLDLDNLIGDAIYLAPGFSCHLRCAKYTWNLVRATVSESEEITKLPECVVELVSMLMSGGGSSRFMRSSWPDTVELCGWPGRGQDDGPLGWPGNGDLLPPARLYEFPPALLRLRGLIKLEVSEHPIVQLPTHGWLELSTLQRLILSSLRLQELPEEIADIKSLKLLFVMQNMLRRLPCALGQHQQLVQLRGTGNQIAALPGDFGPPLLECLVMEGNCIKSCPSDLLLRCRNLRDFRLSGNAMVHGFIDTVSDISATTCSQVSIEGSKHVGHLGTIHLQGCRLAWLPESLFSPCTTSLRYLMLSNNQLQKALPDALVHLKMLEKLNLYGNLLQQLPQGLVIGCAKLSQLLLEDNPLTAAHLDALLRDVQCRGELNTPLHVLGLDATQVRRWRAAVDALPSIDSELKCPDNASETERPLVEKITAKYRQSLPPCVQSGWSVMPGTPWYGKLMPSSQLCRRSGTLTLGEQKGEENPQSKADTRVLMVAFAASGGEPEWARVLANLHSHRDYSHALKHYSLRPTLRDHADKMRAIHQNLPCTSAGLMASLWFGFNDVSELAGDESLQIDEQVNDVDGFDVLLLVDPCRRWYKHEQSGPAPLDCSNFRQCLEAVTAQYGCVCAFGASMGGFAALSCADLFDAVLAFGPQIDLEFAQHRPGFHLDGLRAASQHMRRAVANRRGSVECHTSMDAHLAQAQLFHSESHLHARTESSCPGYLRLIVHPMIGRIAHVLDEASLLVPILAHTLGRLQQKLRNQIIVQCASQLDRCSWMDVQMVDACEACESNEWPAWQWPFENDDSKMEDQNVDEPAILVGHWSGWVRSGAQWLQPTLRVVVATPFELLALAQNAPYAGSWFCPKCGSSNESRWPRCRQCDFVFLEAPFDAPPIPTVPGGGPAFRRGDWECPWCRCLEQKRKTSCTTCGRSRADQTCCNDKCTTRPDALLAEPKPFRCDPLNQLAYCSGCWKAWDNRPDADQTCCNEKCSTCPEVLAVQPRPFRCDPLDQRAYCSGCWVVWDHRAAIVPKCRKLVA